MFYSLYTGLILAGALAVLLLKESLQIPIILLSQVANGILLPFVLILHAAPVQSQRPDGQLSQFPHL